MKKTQLGLMAGAVILTSAFAAENTMNVEKTPTGLTAQTGETTLNISFYSDEIVHVSAKQKLEPTDSLVALPAEETPKFKLKELDDSWLLKGKKLHVNLDKAGKVTFSDNDGNVLLSEKGRSFKAVQAEGTDCYQLEQQFDSSDDEGLYGLGQYQNGIMNWKNVTVNMTQFNQETVNPFLISTRGFGLLWDNYSETLFNPPEVSVPMELQGAASRNVSTGNFTAKTSGRHCFYVVGHEFGEARRRGKRLRLTVGDTKVIHYETIWMPRCISGVMDLKAGETYDLKLENPGVPFPGEVHVVEPDYNKTVFRSTLGNSIEYYFVYGPNMSEVIANNRELTGSAPMLGKWAFGFWQCREKYSTQAELLENARLLREKKIPTDIIVQDWHYWGNNGVGPVFQKDKYPDPAAMAKELHDMNMRMIISVWPRFSWAKMENDFINRGWMLENGDHYYDVFNPEARDLFWSYLKGGIFDNGIDGVWSDGTEPDPQRAVGGQCYLGPFDMFRSAYSMVHAGTIYENHRRDFPEKRVLNLTRSSFSGIQKYGAVVWSGDVNGDWQSLAYQIAAGLNYCASGVPYWTTDIGGFFRDRYCGYKAQYENKMFKELLIRWYQYGAFCPVFRLHGYQSKTELWRYDDNVLNICTAYDELRYRLMPTIYSEAWKVTDDDGTMMRPLAMDFSDDPNTRDVSASYLFGESFLVAPVTEPLYQKDDTEKNWDVYLPAGCDWYDFWTGKKFAGDQTVSAPAPLDTMPLFVKAGSIIALGPNMQYALEKQADPLEIRIYPGADAEFELYEDDGVTYDYEKEAYSTIEFEWDDSKRRLKIEDREGSFKGMLKKRSINVTVVSEGNGIGAAASNGTAVDYTGKSIKLKLD